MSISKQDITAVILAGGRGRRLSGQDKGLIKLNNKPMIEHILDRLKPQTESIIINANRNQKEYSLYGFPVISDELSEFQGPLSGFVSAMRFLQTSEQTRTPLTTQTSHILTLACDAPLLPKDYVARMVSANTTADGIVVAHDGTQLQMTHALIPIALLKSLDSYLEEGQRKVENWYKEYPLILADFSDNPVAFRNINTEEERQKAEKTHFLNKKVQDTL